MHEELIDPVSGKAEAASGPAQFGATLEGQNVLDIESFCADPISQRYEFNFRLPARVAQGPHQILVTMGKRKFAPLDIEVA